ncbi:hypothetical protein IBK40_28685, partial [Escherichia coli]|nr:hypothetical protein [Escherichia coli]
MFVWGCFCGVVCLVWWVFWLVLLGGCFVLLGFYFVLFWFFLGVLWCLLFCCGFFVWVVGGVGVFVWVGVLVLGCVGVLLFVVVGVVDIDYEGGIG